MLVLSRKEGERIFLEVNGVRIVVELAAMMAGKVRIGVTAPRTVTILREEVYRDQYGSPAVERFLLDARS